MNDWIETKRLLDGSSYVSKRFKLFVISSKSKELDGYVWQHVSVSRLDRKMPTYEQLKLVKSHFIGDDKMAIQCFPPISNHVNIHKTCLHLWSCEKDIIPDFTHGMGMI